MDILKAALRCHQGVEFNNTHTQATRKSVTCRDLIQKTSTESLMCESSGISHTDYQGRISLEGEHAVYTREHTHT